MKYKEALNRWLRFGGILYRENEEYFTTDDNGEIEEYYLCRDKENYNNVTLEEMCKIWAENAMRHANETEENIIKYLNY